MESNFHFNQIADTNKKSTYQKILCYNAKNFSALSPEIITELRPKIYDYKIEQQKNLMITLIGIEKEAMMLISSFNKRFLTEKIVIGRKLTFEEDNILRSLNTITSEKILKLKTNLEQQELMIITKPYEELLKKYNDIINNKEKIENMKSNKDDNNDEDSDDIKDEDLHKRIEATNQKIAEINMIDEANKKIIEINAKIENARKSIEKILIDNIDQRFDQAYVVLSKLYEEIINKKINTKINKELEAEIRLIAGAKSTYDSKIEIIYDNENKEFLSKVSELYKDDKYKDIRKFENNVIYENMLLCDVNYDLYYQDCKSKLRELYNEMIDPVNGLFYSVGETSGKYNGDRIIFIYDIFNKLSDNIKLSLLCKIEALNLSESYIILDAYGTKLLMESIGGTPEQNAAATNDEHSFNKISKSPAKESEDSFFDLTNTYNKLSQTNYTGNFNIGKWVVSNSIEYSYLHPLSTIAMFAAYLPTKEYNIRIGNRELKKLVAEIVECMNLPPFSK